MKKTALLIHILLHTCLSCIFAQNWLHMDQVFEYVDLGDLDVAGNQLTIEAKIYQTQASYGDIVSKHSGPTDANFLLRPYRAEITTTNGYAATPMNCGQIFQYVALNTCLHVAMTYDGSMLRHYINSNLNSQTPITGNMYQNNLSAKVGMIAGLNGFQVWEQFYGYITEVRIWNVARPPNQLQQYMDDTLPNPSNQPGLLAYYRFNSLLNLAGSTTFNGTLAGNAALAIPGSFCPALGIACGVLDASMTPPADDAYLGNIDEPQRTSYSWDEQAQLIQLKSHEGFYLKADLVALNGRLLMSRRTSDGHAVLSMSMRSLPTGVYYLRWDNGVDFGVEKVVKK